MLSSLFLVIGRYLRTYAFLDLSAASNPRVHRPCKSVDKNVNEHGLLDFLAQTLFIHLIESVELKSI